MHIFGCKNIKNKRFRSTNLALLGTFISFLENYLVLFFGFLYA